MNWHFVGMWAAVVGITMLLIMTIFGCALAVAYLTTGIFGCN